MIPWRALLYAATVLLLTSSGPLTGAAETTADTIDAAVIFVVDTSASMDREERRLARASHSSAITSPEVIEVIVSGATGRSAFAYVEFARAATVRIGWTLIDGELSADGFARAIELLDSGRSPGGSTTIGAGLIIARQLFEDLPWQTSRRIVNVVGDGVENSGFSLPEARQRLLDLGAVINGMPMLIDPTEADLDVYYARRVIGGPGAFSVPLDDIREMPTLMRQKLIMELY